MQSHEIPIFITTASITLLAGRAVAADRFRNPVTDIGVIVGGILPWIVTGLWWESKSAIVVVIFGSGPLFFAALLRYWLGPRFDNWERAALAMVTGVLAVVGFWASTNHWLVRY